MCVIGRMLIDAKIKTPTMKTLGSSLTKVPEPSSTAVQKYRQSPLWKGRLRLCFASKIVDKMYYSVEIYEENDYRIFDIWNIRDKNEVNKNLKFKPTLGFINLIIEFQQICFGMFLLRLHRLLWSLRRNIPKQICWNSIKSWPHFYRDPKTKRY